MKRRTFFGIVIPLLIVLVCGLIYMTKGEKKCGFDGCEHESQVSLFYAGEEGNPKTLCLEHARVDIAVHMADSKK